MGSLPVVSCMEIITSQVVCVRVFLTYSVFTFYLRSLVSSSRAPSILRASSVVLFAMARINNASLSVASLVAFYTDTIIKL